MKLPKKIKDIIESREIDIHNFTKDDINYRFNEIFSIGDLEDLKSRNITIRSSTNMKEYPFAMGGDVNIEDDIFFIKLFKEGLVNIKLYNVELDLDTKEGKDFYTFINKYISNNSDGDEQMNFFGGNGLNGNTVIDLKKIIENEYDIFIKHLCLNISPGDVEENEDNWDYIFINRLTMSVEISDYRKFFKGYCELLSKDNNLKEIIKKVKNDLNGKFDYSNDSFVLRYDSSYFIKNTGIYSALLFLEKTGKINIINLSSYYSDEDKKSYLHIEFNLYMSVINDIYFEGFELSNDKSNESFKIEYIDKGFNIWNNNEKVFFKNNSKAFKVAELMFKNNNVNKKYGIARLIKLFYGDIFDRSLHKKQIEIIHNAIKSVDRKIKTINNGIQILTFEGEILQKIK